MRPRDVLSFSMKTILFIEGARPNFMKIAALMRAASAYSDTLRSVLIHTGQHYTYEMSEVFEKEFHLPRAYANLDVGSGDRITQTHLIMERLETHLKELKPDMVVVVGDVNSTIAATLAAVRQKIPVAHVEAGLRSNNWRMPEEINRVMTDHLSSLLFASEAAAITNLKEEGIDMSRVHFVGNVMIDTLAFCEKEAEKISCLEEHRLTPFMYGLVTMHRPENVDNAARFMELFGALCEINAHTSLVLPLHPRTESMSRKFGIDWNQKFAPKIIPPQPYFAMLTLMRNARFVLTDSAGIQEETSAFGVPCITMRTETERLVTVTHGTNEVVGVSREKIVEAAQRAARNQWKRRSAVIPLWDGHAAERIMKIIVEKLYSASPAVAHHIASDEVIARLLQSAT